MHKPTVIIMALLIAMCLCACGGSDTSGDAEAPAQEEAAEILIEDEGVPKEEPSAPRTVPLAETVFHDDLAEGNDQVRLDVSAVEYGYFAVSAHSDSRLKLQVLKDEDKYTYDIASDGTVSFFPLQCGSGEYTIRVMENIVDSKYTELYSTICEVSLKDEFQPFIRSSDYAGFDESSQSVKTAAELAGSCENEPEIVAAVYDYVCDNIVYDSEKAAAVTSGYMPVPDDTLKEKKGICFDYASLAAAMLRSQGIPTKLVFGYVSPDDLYHAWNMFYTDETGWVTVGFDVNENDWNRMDLTFSANGADSEFIGDGSNYIDVYYY